jgi:hypothetical protein
MRAAILTALMNFTPAAQVDFFRFLRVPAIVWTMHCWPATSRRTRRTFRCSRRRRKPRALKTSSRNTFTK